VTLRTGLQDRGDLTDGQLIDMLRRMQRIRLVEETIDRLFSEGRVHGTMHLSIGQEASAVGAVSALLPTDYMLSTHRGHGHTIAKGADIRRMLAELLGRDTGYCHGLGGSMHTADVASRHLGANGIVAGGLPIAVGVALALQMKRLAHVVLSFFGDGAANEGAFHEALNRAAIWKLPVVFACENNQYAMSTSVTYAFPVECISERAVAYGLPGRTVDGNDVLAVYQATRTAVERARSGGGPTLLEMVTYRWRGHSKSDQNRYRSRQEIEAWQGRDPIGRFRTRLAEAGILDEATAKSLVENEAREIATALAAAEGDPEPTLDRLLENVYA